MADVALPGMPASRWVTLGAPAAQPAPDPRTHWVDFGGPSGADGADGPGFTIVCVHGLGGSVVDWMRLAPALTGVARVVALDLVGHGLTAGAGRRADVASHRLLLDAFLREVVGGPALLVGNSMGGIVSLLQAVTEPSSVAGLVLVDPALPVPRTAAPDPLVTGVFATYLVPFLAERIMAARRRRLAPETLVRQTLALCAAHPERIPDEVVEASVALDAARGEHADVTRAFLASARSLLSLMISRPRGLRAAVRGVVVPTLLAHGARDRLVPLRSARIAMRARPDWTLAVHPDAGHIPQLEDPAWLAGSIVGWLPALGEAPGAAPAVTPAPEAAIPAPPAPARTSPA